MIVEEERREYSLNIIELLNVIWIRYTVIICIQQTPQTLKSKIL